ncbi:hypothetical protein [Candidatus Spongiihabitans sp.]|uniref:hypothetical protein n=1 Tax=Candidatus Spongiihabitans sp. TaxID=3101308 RepID=UPI003C7A497B
MAMGLCVNGQQRGQTYLYNITGAYSYLSSFLTEVEFILATPQSDTAFPAVNATGANNITTVHHCHILPASHQHQTFVRQTPTSTVEYFTSTGSIQTTVAVGDYGGVAHNDRPVIFGIRITGTGVSSNISRLETSLCLHKYHEDLIHFDPAK